MGQQTIKRKVIRDLDIIEYLENLLDVDMSTLPTEGQVLKYDTTSSKWKPGDSGGMGILDGGTF